MSDDIDLFGKTRDPAIWGNKWIEQRLSVDQRLVLRETISTTIHEDTGKLKPRITGDKVNLLFVMFQKIRLNSINTMK